MAFRLGSLVAVGAVFAAAVSGAAQAQTVDGPSIAWRLGSWGKPRAATENVYYFKRYVEEKTGGKFKISIGHETFGSPKELLDILKVGGLEMTNICSSYHPEKTPAYTGLDLPFLPIPNADVQERVHEAYHKHPVILKEFEAWNARPFMTVMLPQYEFMGRGKPPKTLEDFKGLRVRAIGGIGDAMRKIGAVPTSMDPTEVYTALERGTVDAASGPSTYFHQSYKVYEISKWFSENMSLGTQACPTLININHWAKLPPQYQALFEPAKPGAYAAVKAAYKKADDENIPLFKKKNITFVRFGEAELAEFRKIGGQPVWDEWVAKREAQGIPGRELLDLILTTARGAAPKS